MKTFNYPSVKSVLRNVFQRKLYKLLAFFYYRLTSHLHALFTWWYFFPTMQQEMKIWQVLALLPLSCLHLHTPHHSHLQVRQHCCFCPVLAELASPAIIHGLCCLRLEQNFLTWWGCFVLFYLFYLKQRWGFETHFSKKVIRIQAVVMSTCFPYGHPFPLSSQMRVSCWIVTVALSCNSCSAAWAAQQYLMLVGRWSFLGQQHETITPRSVWAFCKLHINSPPSASVFKPQPC